MKKLFILSILLISNQAMAQQYVNGHYNQNTGSYTQGYYRSTPNYTSTDNYSTQGNTNPYTGSQGSVNVYTPRYNYGYNQGNQALNTLRSTQY